MHLIHLLLFFAARFNLWFTASHIPGKQNILADALSRNNVSLFLLQAPQAAPQGAYLSPSLVGLFTLNIPWTSTNWTNNSFQQDYGFNPQNLQNADIQLSVIALQSCLCQLQKRYCATAWHV